MRPTDSLQTLADFERRLAALGALPIHRDRLLRAWLQGQPLDTGTRKHPHEGFLPLAVREQLPQITDALDNLARIHSEHSAADGSARLLVKLRDGQMVESVLLPRQGVCVSTQVGCAVGCRFCMTGKSGLLRQVSSLEIVAQVVNARKIRAVQKVVFMGMGEPAHNLDNVLEAIDLLGSYGGFNHKKLVFSTVGDLRAFERLPQMNVKPALALSLHTTKKELREYLLPKAPKIAPEELIEFGESYARRVGYPIQYQWTLLDNINDGDDEWDNVVRLLKGKYAMLNLIPFNSAEGDTYARPAVERITAIVQRLHRDGIFTTVRNSAGQDVEGGCGQLRARAVDTDGLRNAHRINIR